MKHPEMVRTISCPTCEKELEAMAFLKLINLGRKEISEAKFQSAEEFIAEMEKEG